MSTQGAGGFKFRKKTPSRDKEPTRAGSGFLISAKGYVVTNAHVITNIINAAIWLAIIP